MNRWLQNYRLLWMVLLFNVVGNACDVMSSRHFPAGFSETNPYARDLFGHFLFWHALAYYGAFFAVTFSVALILYFGIHRLSEVVAQVSFAALFIYDGLRSFSAAIHNLWIHLGWYIGG
jgi:hypothetical protein